MPPFPPNYLDDVAFFLCTGEQAPFKSPSEVDDLTPEQRNYWVSKLADSYKKQQEAMERANRKK